MSSSETHYPLTGVLREILDRSGHLEILAANSVDIAYVTFSLLSAIDIFLVCHGRSITGSFKVFHTLCKKAFPTIWNVADGIGALATVFSRHREQQKTIETRSSITLITQLNKLTGDDQLINYLDLFNGIQLLAVQALAYTPLLSAIAPGYAFALSMGLTAIAETIKYRQAHQLMVNLLQNYSMVEESSDLHTKAKQVRTNHQRTAIAYGVCFVAMLARAIADTVTTRGTPMRVLAAGMLLSAVVRSCVNLANNGYLKDLSLFSTDWLGCDGRELSDFIYVNV